MLSLVLEAAEQSGDKGQAPPLYQDFFTLFGIFVVSASSAISSSYTSTKPPG
jgi:hypothetical protein